MLSICLRPVQHALLSVDGLISYMRSDSSSLDDDSAHQLCEAVAAIFGPEFVTDPPKQYKLTEAPCIHMHTPSKAATVTLQLLCVRWFVMSCHAVMTWQLQNAESTLLHCTIIL